MSGRKKPGFGKQLADLHRWNAWLVVFLALSGLLLSWGAARGWLGGGRVWLKQLHIYIGLITAIFLALYGPLMRKHLKQLRQRPRQRGNLGFVLLLLIGWLLSGIVLWQFRHLPPRWASNALLVHDLLTWAGLPYIAYHSLVRLRWMRRPERRAIRTDIPEPEETNVPSGERSPALHPAAHPQPWMTRRQFVKWSVGIALTAAVAPSFFRWMGKSVLGVGLPGGMADGEDANHMVPEPVPLPDSANVVGGGAKGSYRVYTVTPLPKFDSQNWTFTLDGLVDKPGSWNWQQFLALRRRVQVSDFHCVTGWSVYKNTWEGIPLAQLLAQAGVKPEAKFVKFYSGDGVYTDALSLEQAAMDDIMVAVLHDGKPIGRDYGGPARLIVPKMYGYKSVKWLVRIELIDKSHIGYWENLGYDNDAWV
ncbi:molybdopterin-dependent oxidoreductase [Cohnella zeiphila]|uniref:Molybdopterin-dependent oxidoreductase n=1 Tax=Cohnella zeiphila TaxID=2761120 RepID=A0A7X0VWZ5_9BACL|nr:molybdopterin-dependent oxidoreductase [Cohnella zeiphila]MBB6733030.1 molybdopterin-dependent oxidoreductase [Cohnella zeiphila]